MSGGNGGGSAAAEAEPLRAGETFDAEFAITRQEADAHIRLARIDNGGVLAEAAGKGRPPAVPGRAILARIEGEMTRHPRMRGRRPLLAGADGDPSWGGRSVRFVRPLPAGEILRVRYTVSAVGAGPGGGGEENRIAVDFEGRDGSGRTVVVARRNLYVLGAAGRRPAARQGP